MADDRIIDVNLAWDTPAAPHHQVVAQIGNELIHAGWDYGENEDGDHPTFCRANGPDFDDAIEQARYIVGKWLVVEEPS